MSERRLGRRAFRTTRGRACDHGTSRTARSPPQRPSASLKRSNICPTTGHMPFSARLVPLALAVVALATVLPSSAFAARSFDKQRFGANDTGDITLAANTLMSCPGSCVQRDAAANPSSNSKYNNNDWNMVRVDADGDPATTLNSSTATLDLPAGAKVLFAGLYWGAKTDAGTGGSGADATKRGDAKLKVPGDSYAAVTASNIDDNTDSAYHAFANVTSRVAPAGSGGYAVGDVQAATGAYRYAGLALVVAYHDDDAPTRNLTIFD